MDYDRFSHGVNGPRLTCCFFKNFDLRQCCTLAPYGLNCAFDGKTHAKQNPPRNNRHQIAQVWNSGHLNELVAFSAKAHQLAIIILPRFPPFFVIEMVNLKVFCGAAVGALVIV